MIKIYRILLFLFLCLTSVYALADIIGMVQKVVDGDTIHLTDDNGKLYKIRLLGIDAPEMDQSFGIESRQMLVNLIEGKRVIIDSRKKDKYKRILGKIFYDDMDINLTMISNGLAWHYKRYRKDQSKRDVPIYSEAEQIAKENAIGLWSDTAFIPPWEWRQNKRRKKR
jgi:endonuclease YncB( thermonuclease family)